MDVLFTYSEGLVCGTRPFALTPQERHFFIAFFQNFCRVVVSLCWKTQCFDMRMTEQMFYNHGKRLRENADGRCFCLDPSVGGLKEISLI
nr:hypothetical protein [Bacillota bacterium]